MFVCVCIEFRVRKGWRGGNVKERINIQGSGINAWGCLYGVVICRFMSEGT